MRRILGARFASAAAFTASWDRFGVEIAGRTLKVGLTFAMLAVVAWAARGALTRVPAPRFGRFGRASILWLALLLAWLLARGLMASPEAAIPAFAAVSLPALFYPLAVMAHRDYWREIASAFVYGMVFVSAISVYDWVARSSGLPPIADYHGMIGETPRGTGLSFEPAYFAAAAVAAGAVAFFAWPTSVERTFALFLIGGGLFAANARIAAVQTIVVVVAYRLMVGRRRSGPSHSGRRVRRAVFLGVASVLALAAVSPSTVHSAAVRIASIAELEEPESNSVRLKLYDEIGRIAGEHPIVGIGPGMLLEEFEELGYSVEDRGRSEFVANNIVLQARVDGGFIGLVLQTFLVWSIALTAKRCGLPSIGAAWVSFVVGAGLTVSNFWDSEAWLLAGLIFAFEATRRTSSPSHDRSGRRSDRHGLVPSVGSEAIE